MAITITIHREIKVDGVLADPTSTPVLSNPTGEWGIRDAADPYTVRVANDTSMVKISTGIYEYEFTTAEYATAYEAYVEFQYDGKTYWIEHDIPAQAAESTDTLSVTYPYLRRAIGRLLGYDRDPSNWDATQIADVADVLTSGLRRFYYPPTPEGQPRYEWSFLHRTGSLSLVDNDYAYDLPSDFASLASEPVVDETDGGRVQVVSWTDLESMRAVEDAEGPPMYCAVRPKTPDQTLGSRYEMRVYPEPDASMTMDYRYVCEPGIIDATYEFPLGGAVHGETILQACLAAAEETFEEDKPPVHAGKFAACLAASLRVDQEQKTAQ